MRNRIIVAGTLLVAILSPGGRGTASAQGPGDSAPIALEGGSVTPRVTVRLHAGPSLNLMSDWRDGLNTLWDMTAARGLAPRDKSCICMSWGTTVLVHATERIAVGGTFEMLRDTRSFAVTDELNFFGPQGPASFVFENEAVVRTSQLMVALYPREGSHTHVQLGGGIGTGHTTMSTPGGDAAGRVRGKMMSISAGTEKRFWYVDAGWRFLRMKTQSSIVNDVAVGEARDVFASQAEVHDFVDRRITDLTGGWARIGLAFHFGRR